MAEWNREDIDGVISRINTEIEKLMKEEENIKNSLSIIRESLSGQFERQFSEELKVELKNIDIVIEKLQNEVSAIKKVKKCMEDCENSAKNRTQYLINVMK